MGRRIRGQFNFDVESFQRSAFDGQSFGRDAAGQVASVEGVVALRAGQARRRENEIEPRPGSEGEAVEIFLAAAISEITYREDELAVGGSDEIQKTAAALAFEFAAGGIIEKEGSVRSRIDLAGQALDEDALALGCGEPEVIRGVGLSPAVGPLENTSEFGMPLRRVRLQFDGLFGVLPNRGFIIIA